MGRAPGDGTRLLLRTTLRKAKHLKSSDWEKVKKIFGKEMPKAARVQIEKANSHFLRALRDSEKSNTILRSAVIPILIQWATTTRKLASAIGLAPAGRELSRADAIRRLRQRKKLKYLERQPPLSLLAYTVETSRIAAAAVEKEIASPSADVSRNPRVLWVVVLAEILKQHGISTSANSWTAENPKFVKFIMLMQNFLGGKYPRETEASLIDGLKKAKGVWKGAKLDQLLNTLRKWGRE